MAWTCPRCGCGSYHYNSSRTRYECDGCGHPLADAERDRQLQQYDWSLQQALGHLQAGNWNQTLNLLSPLMQQNPTDTRLYLAALKAATRNFQDVAMMDTGMRSAASDAWDKLIRLNCFNEEMLRYSHARYVRKRPFLLLRRAAFVAALFLIAAFLFIFSSAASYYGLKGAEIFLLYAAGGIVMAMGLLEPFSAIRQLSAPPDLRKNPFQ